MANFIVVHTHIIQYLCCAGGLRPTACVHIYGHGFDRSAGTGDDVGADGVEVVISTAEESDDVAVVHRDAEVLLANSYVSFPTRIYDVIYCC